jgi:hypothetical protein
MSKLVELYSKFKNSMRRKKNYHLIHHKLANSIVVAVL